MAKFLRVELIVPLTDSQAEVLSEETKYIFSSEEWASQVAAAIVASGLAKEDIRILDTEIVDDSLGFVLPEILP